MVSKRYFLQTRLRNLHNSYLLLSLFLSQPSLVLANRFVSFVILPTSSSLQSLHRSGSRQKHQFRRFHQPYVCQLTKIFSYASDEVNCGEIKRFLRKYGFGSRLVTISNADLSQRPILAEMYAEGSWNICLILQWVPPSSSSSMGDGKPPLLEVLVKNDDGQFKDKKVIDIGEPVQMNDSPYQNSCNLIFSIVIHATPNIKARSPRFGTILTTCHQHRDQMNRKIV